MNWKSCFFLIAFIVSQSVHAWNALGHRLVAQIAIDNLDVHTQKTLNDYHQQLDSVYRPSSLVNAAPWMDTLRYDKKLWLERKHYINIPFSRDGTPLVAPYPQNAVTAIQGAREVLANSAMSRFDKGFSVRILLHVVGDLHQPLHSTSQFSRQFPQGDLGGNRVHLGKNSIAGNLHAYWDRGGGLLLPKKHINAKRLQRWAHRIEKKWPCARFSKNDDPGQWALQSHELAKRVVYQISPYQIPSKAYQKQTKKISEYQIALAGCRLACFLVSIN